MRKFLTASALICTVGAACFLGACNKNADKCSSDGACCKDKAAAKMESDATPAAKAGCCKEKAAGCTGEKKVCPATGATSN